MAVLDHESELGVGSIRTHPEPVEQVPEAVAEAEERPTEELQVHGWKQVGMLGDGRLAAPGQHPD